MEKKELKELAADLFNLGMYTPSVEDLFEHINQSDLIHLDEDNPRAWTGWVAFYISGDKPLEIEFSPKSTSVSTTAKRPLEWGRYTKAIEELLRVDLQAKHEALAKTHNLEFELQGDGWGIQVMISIPKDLRNEYFKKYPKD